MAISVIEQPKDFTPCYSPINFVVDETNDLYTNEQFKYILVISQGTTTVTRLKVLPDVNEFYGVFQVEKLLEGFLNEVFDTENEFFTSKESAKEFTFEFGWEYIDGSGNFQQVLNDTSITKVVFNGGLELPDYIDFQEASENPYLIAPSTGNALPLQTQSNIYSKATTRQWLYYMSNDEASSRYLYIETFSEDGTSIGVYRKETPTGLQFNSELVMFGAQVGLDFLQSNSPDDFSGQVGFWTAGNESYYQVWMASATGVQTSTKTTINISDTCSMWKLYNVYYLNSLGGISSFPFHGRNEQELNINREKYRRKEYNLTSSGLNYDLRSPQKRDYNTNYTKTLQLNSEFVSEERQNELDDMKTSPIAWVETPSGLIISSSVDEDSFTFANKNNNELISVTFNVEFGYKTKRQSI